MLIFVLFISLFIDLFLILFVFRFWLRSKSSSNDFKLNRGLQILDGKMEILEDLSERTGKEYEQLTELLEKKSIQISKKIQEAKLYVQKIEEAIAKSYKVVKIFREKIPHKELAEKEKALNYIKAAKKAYAGEDVEKISKELNLPLVEVELIHKFNKASLNFKEEDLAPWVRRELGKDSALSQKTP